MQPIHRLRRLFIFLTLSAILITILFIFLFERFALPVGIKIAEEYATTFVNTSLNGAVKKSTERYEISAEDLYTVHFGDDGKLNYLEVNSILINELCADTAEELSESLNKADIERVRIPIGVLTGVNMLSEMGPCISVRLTHLGSARTDYETSLDSAGIGQVNFKVWLVADCEMGMVNPLFEHRIKITRKLMLVNTVFSGEVPSAFYGER